MESDLAEMFARLEEQKAKSSSMREQIAGLQGQVGNLVEAEENA